MPRSPSAILAELKKRAEKLEEDLKLLRRGIKDLENAIGETVLEFDDSDLSVAWAGGRFSFRKDSPYPYVMLRVLYDAGEEGLSQAELAEAVYGDEMADVKRCAYGLKAKLEQHNCPIRVISNKASIWVENA